MRHLKFTLLLLLTIVIGIENVYGQMERKRAVEDGPVEDIFLAGSIAGLSTVTALPARNMNSMVMHNFGLVSGGIHDFYGLDGGAAVRLGIDYGITDKLDVGIGRTGIEDVVDLRFKYILLEQLKSDKIPVQIALKGNIGISTLKERRFDYNFTERLNYLGSVMVARKFNDQFSLQLSPMISHFNTVVIEEENDKFYNTMVGLGVVGRYKLNNRTALAIEYLPVLSKRNSNTKNHMALSYEIDTGGHVFQLFFMTGRWFTEQHLLARTDTDLLNMDFRFGFNINRFFGIGK
jgi:hypothetical protein